MKFSSGVGLGASWMAKRSSRLIWFSGMGVFILVLCSFSTSLDFASADSLMRSTSAWSFLRCHVATDGRKTLEGETADLIFFNGGGAWDEMVARDEPERPDDADCTSPEGSRRLEAEVGCREGSIEVLR
jgi:hypothetical protein